MWLTAEPASDSEIPMQNSPSPVAAMGSQRFRNGSFPSADTHSRYPGSAFPRSLSTVSGNSEGVSAMGDTALPVEWTTAQPYDQWRAARESGCPVIETAGSGFDPRVGYQVTDWE